MAEYGASRHPRFSVSAAATTPVPAMAATTTVHPSMIYGAGLQQIEKMQVKQSTAKRHSLASQYDLEAAAFTMGNQRHGKRQSPDRQVTSTRQSLSPSHTRRRATYHEEHSFQNTVLPTDIFAHTAQFASLQEWLSGADSSFSTSLHPVLAQTPPPEVTFPDLELLDDGIGEEEPSLCSDAYFNFDGVPAVAHLDGDAVMGEEDEDVDAEGSTEDESELSGLDEPEDERNLQGVSGDIVKEVIPEPGSATQLPGNDPPPPPEIATKVGPGSATRCSTADTIATDTAGTPDHAVSRRSTPVDAPATPDSCSSHDGSVLSSADGEGETEDEDEYVDSPDEDEDEDEDASSTTLSRSPSPASSVSVPLSSRRPAAFQSSPHQEPKGAFDDVNCQSPPRSSSPLTPPPKACMTKPRTRAPYQRSRPPTQPLDGIVDGFAEYSEATKTYKCTCHGRTYRRKGDLQRHLSEGSLPEVCDGCGRGFPRKDPRIRHWNQNPRCEAIHHVKNICDAKEASRWNKRWTSAMFIQKAPAMQRLVEDQLSMLASGSALVNHIEEIIPRSRTRNRGTPAARRPRHKKVKRRLGSEAETEEESDDEGCEEEDSFHPSKLVEFSIVKDDMVSESRRATLRRKTQ
ncbi:hypothetical protein FRC01_002987 [Tulasnella sp. 417]|nr:hypothetical protein FRC01_002987 [Tulasnella sp. 417]